MEFRRGVPNIVSITGSVGANTDLAAAGSPGDQVIWIITLTGARDRQMFASEHVSLFQDAADDLDNLIPPGANVDAADYQVLIWPDWGMSDDKNIVILAFVRNLSAGIKTVLVRANMRNLITAGIGGL